MKIKPTAKPGRVVVELGRRDDSLLAEHPPGAAAKAATLQLKKILVPIDFSDCSRKALQYAIPFARQFGASLVLLHVIQVSYAAGSEFGVVDVPVLERDLRESSEKELTVMAGEVVGHQVPAEALVRTGRPVQEIVEAAKQLEVDLIIIATHGRTGLKHVFLGSTTESVVRAAPCPVLTVREHEHEFV